MGNLGMKYVDGPQNGSRVGVSVAHVNALQRTSTAAETLSEVDKMTPSEDVSQPLNLPPWHLFSGSMWERRGINSKDIPSSRQAWLLPFRSV